MKTIAQSNELNIKHQDNADSGTNTSTLGVLNSNNNRLDNTIIAAGTLLTFTIAAYAALKRGNYRIALLAYTRGGGGINLYKKNDIHTNNQKNPIKKEKRIAAIDFHPLTNPVTKKSEWSLHYHTGKTNTQVKKHRSFKPW